VAGLDHALAYRSVSDADYHLGQTGCAYLGYF